MPRALKNMDYVILLCSDIQSMRAFYNETLGFPVYVALGDWIELQVGATLLTLRRRGRSYDGPELPPQSAAVQLAFRVAPDEVDQWHAELVSKGVEILEGPIDREFGHRTLHFKDPEGNILEIYADISLKPATGS